MARNFDAGCEDINVGKTGLGITGNISLSIWVFTDNRSGFHDHIAKTTGSSPQPWDWYQLNGDGRMRFLRIGCCGLRNSDSTTAVPLTQWAFTGVLQRGLGCCCVEHFLDGATDGTGTINATPNCANLDVLIGNRAGHGTDMVGDMGWATVWDTDITANEMNAIGRGVNPFPIEHANIQLLTPIWGNEDPEPDYSGNGNIGTVTSASRSTSNPPVELIENYLGS